MRYKNIIKYNDSVFANRCADGSINRKFINDIRYDKTLSERLGTFRTEFDLHGLKSQILSNDKILACRIIGSYPVKLDGLAKFKVEETLNDIVLSLYPTEITKLPDIDLEVVTDGVLESPFEPVNMSERRLSVGYIDGRGLTDTFNIKGIIRWGFIRNEIIIKNQEFYIDRSNLAWDFIDRWCLKDTLKFVGNMHLYYAIKNSIKCGKLERFDMVRSDDTELFDVVSKWKHTKSDLYFKEDL